jgi:hypothetical protein
LRTALEGVLEVLEAVVVRPVEEDGNDVEAAVDAGMGMGDQEALGDLAELRLLAAILPGVTDSSGRPWDSSARVLTSTNTRAAPSRATMSISPRNMRKPRATIS